MSDEGKPVRMAFSVTHQRVSHYNDVVEYMVAAEIDRCKSEEKFIPSPSQIAFLRKELVRYAVIRHDIATAQTIRIRKSEILNETPSTRSLR